MYLLNILIPLISFFCVGCFGFLIGKKGAMLLTTFLLMLATCLSYIVSTTIVLNSRFDYITLSS